MKDSIIYTIIGVLLMLFINAVAYAVEPEKTGGNQTDLAWLALNIHHEARGEPFVCQVAVAEVTLRRARSEYYPNSVMEVVTQPYQFSWTIGREFYDFTVIQPESFVAAAFALSDTARSITTDQLHYAHKRISNYWTKTMKPSLRCGNHVFYSMIVM